MEPKAKAFLEQYLDTLTDEQCSRYHSFSADYFCADEVNANFCAELIKAGTKTATCSLKYWYDNDDEPMPEVGHLMVVTDWDGNPVCIVETDTVEVCKYADVTAEFAYLEGEGDRTLENWRQTHWDFFAAECAELDIAPSEEMMLVLETFHVVYPQP